MNRPRGSVVFVPDPSTRVGPENEEPLVRGVVVRPVFRPDPAKRRFPSADPILSGYVVELPDGRVDEYRLGLCKFPPRSVA